MTIYTTIGERINLSACDAGHESDADLPHATTIEGLAENKIELFLCQAHRASLLAMLRRRFGDNGSLRDAVADGDEVPWIKGDAPASDWAEITPEHIAATCARTGLSKRAWWLATLRLSAMGVCEMARDDDGRTYMRMWDLSNAGARE